MWLPETGDPCEVPCRVLPCSESYPSAGLAMKRSVPCRHSASLRLSLGAVISRSSSAGHGDYREASLPWVSVVPPALR